MIKCVIVEDEPQAVNLLKNIIKQRFNTIEVVACFDKISLACNYLKQHKVDFIFLDVQLNGELGIDIANYLKPDELNFDIIFTTAYAGFALEAFGLSAIDYILKPINEDRLVVGVERVLKKQHTSIEQLQVLQNISKQNNIEKIILSTLEKKISINTHDVILLKADNVYTEFYLKNNQKVIVSKPLKEYELLLTQVNFYKPHRSFIINKTAIKCYNKANNQIEMVNGELVSLARDKKKEFEDLFLK
jgi:two-component system, LytTR family, response regulator